MLTHALMESGEHSLALGWADDYFDELRRREFGRLDASGETYLDYTGSALYAESQIVSHAETLRRAVLGNPHSESEPSRASTDLIADARERVLRFFAADPSEYAVCFTANASGAIRLVAEAYPFEPGCRLVLSADNHNSVNGIREIAHRAGAAVDYIPLDDELRLTSAEEHLAARDSASRKRRGLFAFPAQSNFSGVRHPLSLISTAHDLGYDVLLDAASYVPTSPLRLSDTPADFVAISFYKMFGYPTGLGALIARHDALSRLRRPWFAGGTVEYASVQHTMHQLKAGAEAFEDGTPNFLGLAALPAGLALLETATMGRVRRRIESLTALLLRELRALRHTNGRPMIALHGPSGTRARGGTVAFSVLGARGRHIDYARVEAQARAMRVSVRGGCFCNPGAAERAFALPAERMRQCLADAAVGGFTPARLSACLGGRPVGAVRMSLGLPTTTADVERGVEAVAWWKDRA